ncbi:hypothetical protein C7N43_12455 [Sphingobacteriales bacterium UPWRP_1]|nr:hypothetical protein B6N25_03845 [Sphingobacteriales bacterium TSM_CSS]PSJ76656.1 hypothetical protein C7N43_12455 [Sphingobacteriales bacterium UPWRP_1]
MQLFRLLLTLKTACWFGARVARKSWFRAYTKTHGGNKIIVAVAPQISGKIREPLKTQTQPPFYPNCQT